MKFVRTHWSLVNNSVCFALCASLCALSHSAEAQQPKRIPKIGVLFPGSRETFSERTDAFIQGMKDLGYIEGKTILIEWRWAGDKVEQMPELAMELVQMNPDRIIANGQGECAGYGYRRLGQQLRREGIVITPRKSAGAEKIPAIPHPLVSFNIVTTDSNHGHKIYPNLLTENTLTGIN